MSTLAAQPAWTWARQLSTYRYWGLLLFYVFAGAVSSLVYQGVTRALIEADVRPAI
jgi:hypothetical protein